MRRILATACLVGSLALGVFAPSVTVADRTNTNRSSSDFWFQFEQGDSNFNVYNSLGRLVLTTYDSQKRATILMWDGSSFSLFVRGEEITDLTTGQDVNGRPTFAGKYDTNSEPQLTGFVDVTPDGNRIVQIYENPEVVNARWETDSFGAVVAFRTCECSAVYVNLVCESKHCNQNPPPHCNAAETVRCSWLAMEGL